MLERKCKGSFSLNVEKERSFLVELQTTLIVNLDCRWVEDKALSFFLRSLEYLPTYGKETISFSFSIWVRVSGFSKNIFTHLSKICCGYWFLRKRSLKNLTSSWNFAQSTVSVKMRNNRQNIKPVLYFSEIKLWKSWCKNE